MMYYSEYVAMVIYNDAGLPGDGAHGRVSSSIIGIS